MAKHSRLKVCTPQNKAHVVVCKPQFFFMIKGANTDVLFKNQWHYLPFLYNCPFCQSKYTETWR